MPRPRAVLAILLAAVWFSAVWHAELEAVEMMLEHEHHGHSEAADVDHRAAPEHEPLLVSQFVKDAQVRVGALGALCVAFMGLFAAGGLWFWRADAKREPVPIAAWLGPPLDKVWRFVQRCAPDSAAPPALA